MVPDHELLGELADALRRRAAIVAIEDLDRIGIDLTAMLFEKKVGSLAKGLAVHRVRS